MLLVKKIKEIVECDIKQKGLVPYSTLLKESLFTDWFIFLQVSMTCFLLLTTYYDYLFITVLIDSF